LNIRKYAKFAAVPTGLLVAGLLVGQASSAAFTAQTSTGANTFASGTVTLTNDKSATSVFNVAGMVPGSTGSNTVVVNYTGSVAAPVKMFATSTVSDALATAMTLTVTESGNATPIFNGTLADFSKKTTFATGWGGSWTAAPGANATKTYTITYTLPTTATDALQGLSTGLTFAWAAQTA